MERSRRGSVFRNMEGFWCTTPCCSLWMVHLQIPETASELLNETAQLFTSGPVWVWGVASNCISLDGGTPWPQTDSTSVQISQQWLCSARRINVGIHTNDCWQHKGEGKEWIWLHDVNCFFTLFLAYFCHAQQGSLSFSSTLFFFEIMLLARSRRGKLQQQKKNTRAWKDCLRLLSSFTLLTSRQKAVLCNSDITLLHAWMEN